MATVATKNDGTAKRGSALRASEFFAGIGLVRLGLEREGWRVVFANDIDHKKQEMYEANFGADHFRLGDIHDLSPRNIPTCDLFTASFPCNDLSIAGAMVGLDGKHSGAFWGLIELLRGLKNKRPPLVLLENVVGFLMSNAGRDFYSALAELNSLGYACDAFILNASSFVPQSRARLFVVAKRIGAGRSKHVATSAVRPSLLAEFINSHGDIKWDVRELPVPPARTILLEETIEELPASHPHWWATERAEYFWNQLSERHLAVAEAMRRGSKYSYGTAFRRVRYGRSMAELRTDGLAGCLRTPRGGSGRQIILKAGRGKYFVRLMTPRECARLQGVPDSYVIDAPSNQALFGFGDAVCVPVISWIAKHYLNPVAKELLGRTVSA